MKTTPKKLYFAIMMVLVTLGSFALAYHNVFGVFTHEQYGTFLTDTTGKTLYIFRSDTQGSGESTCYDSCASAWPPYIVSEAPGQAHDEVTGELGIITRKDGSLQATYNGWPLYYFAGDAAPGDANGQNVGEIWFVANVE